MQLRKLGHSSLEVAPIFFGGNVFGWTADEPTSLAVLDAFLEAGGNAIDTADVYGTGTSETIIGRWMKARGNRDKVIIATKLGSQMAPDKKGLARNYIFAEVEASLQRLQTDHIDLYQAHRDDPETPLEETLEAFNELVKQGKVRAIGASNYSAARLAEAEKISQAKGYARYESLQPEYNLAVRADYEHELEPLCREQSIGVIPYFALASGFLSGKYRAGKALPNSQRAQRVQQRYMNERGFGILEAVDRVAREHRGATPTQVSLAWLIAQPTITAPIASATSVEQVRELMGATELQLSKQDLEVLDQASKE
jgi:aryl-alcohol dehydrogenase-like predicted oxidoreductase